MSMPTTQSISENLQAVVLAPVAQTAIGWSEYLILLLIGILCCVLYGLRRGMTLASIKHWLVDCRAALVVFKTNIRDPNTGVITKTHIGPALREFLFVVVHPAQATGLFDQVQVKTANYVSNLSFTFTNSLKISKSTKYIFGILLLLLIVYFLLQFF